MQGGRWGCVAAPSALRPRPGGAPRRSAGSGRCWERWAAAAVAAEHGMSPWHGVGAAGAPGRPNTSSLRPSGRSTVAKVRGLPGFISTCVQGVRRVCGVCAGCAGCAACAALAPHTRPESHQKWWAACAGPADPLLLVLARSRVHSRASRAAQPPSSALNRTTRAPQRQGITSASTPIPPHTRRSSSTPTTHHPPPTHPPCQSARCRCAPAAASPGPCRPWTRRRW